MSLPSEGRGARCPGVASPPPGLLTMQFGPEAPQEGPTALLMSVPQGAGVRGSGPPCLGTLPQSRLSMSVCGRARQRVCGAGCFPYSVWVITGPGLAELLGAQDLLPPVAKHPEG